MAGISALLRSAASTRSQIATYQDQLMAYEYGNSAYTDTALATYASYLKDRISSLSASSSVADASKALSLTKALDSATKSNISATIQRENIQVLSGNASLTDKYNVIAQQFVRAQANGDMTLAQTLEGQAYSLSQTIQLQAQTAAQAALTEAKAASDLGATSQAGVAKTLESALSNFNTNYVNAGKKSSGQVISDFVKSMQPTFETLGIHLQPGMQPNYFDIVDGTNRAIYKAYQNASAIATPYNPDLAQTYSDKATAAVASIHTIYGTMNAQELQQAAANPQSFSYATDPQFANSKLNRDVGPGGLQNPQTGYQQTSNGIQPTFAQSPWLDIPNTLNNQLQALHLRTSSATPGNGVLVTATDQSPQWIKQILSGDATTHILSTGADANGNAQLQFEADAVHGPGKAIYTIARDGTAWESSALGDRLLAGTPASQQAPTSVFGKIGEAFMAGVNNVASMFNAKAYADGLPSNMLQQATSHYTLPALPKPQLPIALPNELPKLSVAQPTPQAPLAVAKPAPTVAPATVNPQLTVGAPQVQPAASGIPLQGGSSGGGIRLQ